MAMDEIVDGLSEVSCDVLVIGGGTAGPMAALKAKLKNPKANVVLLEKANVKRSGAISMGMDGLNNAVISGVYTLQHQAGCTNDVIKNNALTLAAEWHADDMMANRNINDDIGSDGTSLRL